MITASAVKPLKMRRAPEPLRHRSGMDRYKVFNRISQGTYGAVYRAWDLEKDELVAIKHELHGLSKSTKREIAVLKSLRRRHPSIVDLKEVVVDASRRVFVVMEYFPFDLKRFVDARPQPCAAAEVKGFMKQILRGVEFLHGCGVTHRDLKPSNILVDREGRNLKICDFGCSRRLGRGTGGGACTPGVMTLWYRAPEILLGAETYTSAVDMWSVGCIMAELAIKEVLFPGTSEIDQLCRIRKTMESSSATPWPVNLLQRLTVAAAAAKVPRLSSKGFDLLQKLLAMNPNGRITARDALRHGWFSE